jgi:hypothetical protein
MNLYFAYILTGSLFSLASQRAGLGNSTVRLKVSEIPLLVGVCIVVRIEMIPLYTSGHYLGAAGGVSWCWHG